MHWETTNKVCPPVGHIAEKSYISHSMRYDPPVGKHFDLASAFRGDPR